MKIFFKVFLVFAFISNVVLAYGNSSFTFTSGHQTEYSNSTSQDYLYAQDGENSSSPLSLLLLIEEEETETNEEFLQATFFIVAFFNANNWVPELTELPKGDYAYLGTKIRTQNIYTFIETFRI